MTMRLIDAYHDYMTDYPEALRKRICSVARTEMTAYEYYISTMFAVRGLRVFAFVTDFIDDGNTHCGMYPMDNGKIYQHDLLYLAKHVSPTSRGLMACISDWLDLVVPDFREFGDFRREDGSFRSDFGQWTGIYYCARQKYSTDCSGNFVEPRYHLLRL